MKKNNTFKIGVFAVIVVFIVYIIYCECKQSEGFVSGQCPNTLIKDGNQILLYNPEMAKIPGVNPVVFKSLKDYEKYIKWQRANGLNCPILHLEKVYDTQNTSQYEVRNSFMTNEPVGAMNHNLPNLRKPPCMDRLLNANIENKPYNQNMYPSFDPYNQDIGKVMDNALEIETST